MSFLRSFRGRLTFFFVAIVIVPMASLSVIVVRLLDDNESAKADARIAARQETAINLFERARAQADEAAVEVGQDVELATALRAGDPNAAEARAEELVDDLDLKRLVIRRGPATFVDVGSPEAVFPARRDLVGENGESFGLLLVSTTGPRTYSSLVSEATGLEVVISRPTGEPVTTLEEPPEKPLPPDPGVVELDGTDYRAASFTAPSFGADRTQVTVLADEELTESEQDSSRGFALALLGGFFVLAFLCAIVVARALQRQIEEFLEAARRIGRGDFTTTVPTLGRDEFAALGAEFNSMSAQLQAQISALEAQQHRLVEAMRTIGDTAASNLDRVGLLEIVVRTAVDGVAGGTGASRATLREAGTGPFVQVAVDGDPAGLEAVIHAAESDAVRTAAPAAASTGDAHALAFPLRGGADGPADAPRRVTGIVVVARREAPFTASDRDLFHYLGGQASVSLENVDLHHTVERHATTDALTGLSNRRRFEETLATEVERARRFGQPLGLVMLDIDDFKRVNDTWGHQVGDEVLVEVSRVLRESSREIDEPARFGGEELAVVLPQTDLDGAYNLAERVREGIAALELPLDDGGVLRVTASLGAAELPSSATDEQGLVAAADDALYSAKRGGKNCTVRAVPVR